LALTSMRMPDYPRQVGSRPPRPLRDRDTTPRVAQILGIPAQDLLDALAVACASGSAVLFSPTSDGGAISVTLYMGDARSRDYASSAEEFAQTLIAVRDACEARVITSPNGLAKRPVRASEGK
jgi:hypothetical protein